MKIVTIGRLICAIALVLAGFSLAQGCPCHSCDGVHVFSLGDEIQLGDIIPQHLQDWYHIGSATGLKVYAEDWDWVDCCSDPGHTGWVPDYIVYEWTGPGLVGDLTRDMVYWWPDSHTAKLVDIKVTADDYAYMLTCDCDAGSRDDDDKEKTIKRGAWKAAASMVVYGTNSPTPQTVTAYEDEYFNYHVYPPLLDTPPKERSVSLNSSHISISNYDDNTVISPNPQEVTLEPMITSQADWNMFCVPEGKWAADMSGFVVCTVDRRITGHIWSKVWDNAPTCSGGDVTVNVALLVPPISIGISKTFDLSNALARSQVAMGFGYLSDLPFTETPYGGKFEHRADSNWYSSYPGGSPHIGYTSIDSPWSPFIWCVSKALGTDKTASMQTKTKGWVKAKETMEYDPYWQEVFYDAYGEVWQAGTITYRIWSPYYFGTRHSNPAW